MRQRTLRKKEITHNRIEPCEFNRISPDLYTHITTCFNARKTVINPSLGN